MVDLVISARPNIISHNLETVRRLTPSVRSVATYERSLAVLGHIAKQGIPAKTGIMLGLGESEEEILETMDDALSVGVSILTIGQYLRPSRKNIPVEAYIEPAQFDHLREVALQKGFVVPWCALRTMPRSKSIALRLLIPHTNTDTFPPLGR